MARALHFVAADTSEAQAALTALRGRYEDVGPDNAEIVVALGGDGFMLQALHTFLGKGKPIYGMHLGSVGFLMNEYRETGLKQRLEQAEAAVVHPLKMRAYVGEKVTEALAFNEVSLLRQTRQA